MTAHTHRTHVEGCYPVRTEGQGDAAMTKPYYSDDHCTIYHGDCLVLADVWGGADVMVTDPPYGIGWTATPEGWTNSSGGGGHRSSGNSRSILNDKDLSARDNALAAWGDKLAVVFGALTKPQPAGTCQVLIYAKPVDAGIMGARAGRRKDAEAIYLVGPWPTGIGGKSSIITTHRLVAGPTGVARTAGHPHAKPVDVMSELIDLAPGVVVDPFMGSGTTLRAAKDLGRKAIGIEIEERYCEIAAKRLAQEVLAL